MSTEASIHYTVEDRVAIITLNRPNKLNAWTATMEGEVKDALLTSARDPAISCIIITGAGRGFCAGADLSPSTEGKVERPSVKVNGDFHQRYSYMFAVEKPIIAAINGPVAGVGLCIALFCDFRFVSDNAKIVSAFSKLGLVAEHGSAWLLPRLVGPMNALEILMSSRPLGALEADRLGLARHISGEDFLNSVLLFARQLTRDVSPRSLRVIKRQVYEALNLRLGEAIIRADAEQLLSIQSKDFREGIDAFREGRKPQFEGL